MNGIEMQYEKKEVKYLELYIEPENNDFKSGTNDFRFGINDFKAEKYVEEELPVYNKDRLPAPIYDENPDLVDLYYKSFELAFNNLKQPTKDNGFIKNYIDTAFNDSIFLWDSYFIAMYGKYASNVFDFQGTLDNFYMTQEPDGFIGREIIRETGLNKYHRFDPVSTGPNIMAFAEWQQYEFSWNTTRLTKVYPVILKYHQWLKLYRTHRDGSYWYTGWSCGADNQLRISKEVYDYSYHDHMSWIDATLHQIISCKYLMMMADELGVEIPKEIPEEKENLTRFVNERMWDEESGFYYDLKKDETLSSVKTLVTYWVMFADVMTKEQEKRMIDKLFDKEWFYSKYPFATLARSDNNYEEMGKYWRGGVWSPMNYMVVKGITGKVSSRKIYDVVNTHLGQINDVYKETGTIWENYAPEHDKKGEPSKPNFMGWTGLSTISMFIEYLIGIKIDVRKRKIRWDLTSLKRCGVENLNFGSLGQISLCVEERSEAGDKPRIGVKSSFDDYELDVYVDDVKVEFVEIQSV